MTVFAVIGAAARIGELAADAIDPGCMANWGDSWP